MKILIADKFEPAGVEGLQKLGCDVAFEPDLKDDSLVQAVKDGLPDVLVVRSTKVPQVALEASDSLSLVVRAGAGYDTIDVESASARGIFVANCPGKNAIAVAEIVWGLILSCDRRVPDQTIDIRDGMWKKKEYAKAAGLYGRTLGVVGLGQIGQEVANRGKAFGMKVVGWSRSLTQERADELGIGFCSSLINLAKMSDVVSINIAANAETAKLLDAKFFQSMKDGAYFINTSRGSVVDEAALTEAINTKRVRAGLDVYDNEPAAADSDFTNPIVKLPGVYGTHHVGASTDQAQLAVATEVVRIVDQYQQNGHVTNCVNRAASTPATWILTVRHLNKPGVLAHVFYTLGQAGINVEEMENIIYEGTKAACARIQLDDEPTGEVINTIRGNDNVLSVSAANISS